MYHGHEFEEEKTKEEKTKNKYMVLSINELRSLVDSKYGDYPDGANREELIQLIENERKE